MIDKYIQSDLYRYEGKVDFKSFVKCLKNEPGFRYTFFHRKCLQLDKFSIGGIICRFFLKRYRQKYGYQIPETVKIGKGLMLKHWGYVVINSKSIIGDNCTILQGVTLGQTNRGEHKGAPTIGNEVYLSPGCAVVGKVTIGNNVLIGPNAYVNFDVPDNSIVIGNPGKIISKENATEGYIVNLYSIPSS